MAISKETVEYVTHLARIELQPNELDKLSGQLTDILRFIDKITQLDITNVTPTRHILPLANVLRDDLPKDSLSADKALGNAPQREGNFYGVPKVIE